LTLQERKNIERFKAYKEQLVEHEVQFGSIFRGDSRALLDNSKSLQSFHIDVTSRGSIGSSLGNFNNKKKLSYKFLEFPKGSLKNAFRLEAFRNSVNTNSPGLKGVIKEESSQASPREEIIKNDSGQKMKTLGDEPNSPDEGLHSEDTQESWAGEGIKPERKLKRLTENEEIYMKVKGLRKKIFILFLKAKKLMRDKLKDNELQPRGRSKLLTENTVRKFWICKLIYN